MSKRVLLIAGPNGAGKTTFARSFLPVDAEDTTFINADLIAAGLDPFAPERAAVRAGRLMLELVDDYARRGESFAVETTLSGRGYTRLIPTWRAAGYHVTLIFLELPSADVAIERVAERVRQGGHHIPDEVVRRRFSSGLEHFHTLYKPLVDAWLHFDNAGTEPVLIDWSE